MTTTETSAPAQPVTTCPPSEVCDMIVRWSEVQAGDLVLLGDELTLAETVHVYQDTWNRETGETFTRVDVGHRRAEDGYYSVSEQHGDRYTAVRRYTEGLVTITATLAQTAAAGLDEAADDRIERARYAADACERQHTQRAVEYRQARDELIGAAGTVPAAPEFPAPTFSHRAYGVDVEIFGEDGGMVARDHVPDLRFIAACNHYARKVIGLRNIWDMPTATLEDALSTVSRVWAISADPSRYGGDPDLWAVRYDSSITEQTPGAFPLTVLLP